MAEVDHDSLESSRSSIFQTEVDVQDKEPAKRVEEEKFMFSVKGQRLPKAAQFPVIAEDVAESMGIAEGLALRRWRRYFHSPKCKAIITDLFWYCYCTFYKKNKTKESVKRLQDRVAENYAAMLYEVTIQNGDRDLFLPGLTNAMAQAVFLSFYQSYPRSRVKFDETFKINVIDTCSAWLDGTRATNPYFQHWQNTMKEGKMSRGNMSGGLNESSQTAGFGQFSRRNRLVADSMPTRRKPRMKQRLITFEHTPLMQRFLSHKYGPGFNTMTKMTVRLTENPDRPILSTTAPEQKIARKKPEEGDHPQIAAMQEEHAPETFKDIVMNARKKAKSLMSAHTTAMTHVFNETAADRRELARAHDDIESKYKAVRDTDIHEFSNFLTAKMKAEAEHHHKH